MRQLRLLAEESTAPVPAGVRRRPVKDRLSALLDGGLDFAGARTGYASHHLHSFAAKFPPQLPRHFILGLTAPGDLVLDPMAGSGTTVVEAVLLGRRGVGVDLDPLAVQIGRVKTAAPPAAALGDAGRRVLTRARRLFEADGRCDELLAQRFDEPTRAFLDYWFLPTTQRELVALVTAVQDEPDPAVRRFLYLTISSIIVTKSGGVSLARDLAHSRPHRDADKEPRSAFEQFRARLSRNLRSVTDMPSGEHALILQGDAAHLPLAGDSAHLIVTSPPYANAIDYMRAHKFSLVWLGHSIPDLSEWRARYIGAERLGGFVPPPLPPRSAGVVRALAERDGKKARILAKYFVAMGRVFGEMHRVLRPGAAAIVVVGTSTMRGLNVQTHLCLAEMSTRAGFEVVRIAERKLDRNRRMMPARFGRRGKSQIEERMYHEYVLGLLKAARRPLPRRRAGARPGTPTADRASIARTNAHRESLLD